MKLAECSSQTPEMMSKNVSGNVVLSTKCHLPERKMFIFQNYSISWKEKIVIYDGFR